MVLYQQPYKTAIAIDVRSEQECCHDGQELSDEALLCVFLVKLWLTSSEHLKISSYYLLCSSTKSTNKMTSVSQKIVPMTFAFDQSTSADGTTYFFGSHCFVVLSLPSYTVKAVLHLLSQFSKEVLRIFHPACLKFPLWGRYLVSMTTPGVCVPALVPDSSLLLMHTLRGGV